MNNYSDPIVTYDEIVEALKAIIECAKANGYIEEYGFLNAKYDSLSQNPVQTEQEQALIDALQSLEKIIDDANAIIRNRLEQIISELNAHKSYVIKTNYVHRNVKRKLASQNELVMKLKRKSLPLDILNNKIEVEEELPLGFEEIIEEPQMEQRDTKADLSKIQILKKALDKALENGNQTLANVLEQQLLKAIESIDLK